MNRTQLFEIVGVTAIVLSLLFVAFEIQQANRIAIVSTNNEVYASFSSINEIVMSDPEFADLLVRSSNAGGDELSTVDRIRLSGWVRRHLNVWLPATIAHGNGMLTEDTYKSIFDDARGSLEEAGPEMLSIWKDVLDEYPGLASTELFFFINRLFEEFEAR